MDLGIEGRRAIVCASSAGLGLGVARALAADGVELILCARGEARLRAAADGIAADFPVPVRAIVCDVATEAGRAALLEACPEPDILINNAGGPPPGDFRDWDRDDWLAAVDANMLAPIFLIKATIDGMIARRFGRIVNITSGAVKSPAALLGLSNGARSGLTGFVGGLARQVAGHNVTINSVLPGQFDTDRLKSLFSGMAARSGGSIEQARETAAGRIPAGRFGEPDEFGALCAFLCSARAGFITGQNILIDGGAFPGLL
ncbi:MAG: SDR family oxidoreductase [Caulobacteraceae bacterium]|nr:SDR family oxidoreductase [Caulobacteraceae bacterium]